MKISFAWQTELYTLSPEVFEALLHAISTYIKPWFGRISLNPLNIPQPWPGKYPWKSGSSAGLQNTPFHDMESKSESDCEKLEESTDESKSSSPIMENIVHDRKQEQIEGTGNQESQTQHNFLYLCI